MDEYVIDAKQSFENAIANLKTGMDKLRTGQANPAMLSGVTCDYYGEKMPIMDLCQISRPEPRQLYVRPYSREDIKPIAAGIAAANLGVNPQVEADGIRIIVAALTEDTRKEIAKKASGKKLRSRSATSAATRSPCSRMTIPCPTITRTAWKKISKRKSMPSTNASKISSKPSKTRSCPSEDWDM